MLCFHHHIGILYFLPHERRFYPLKNNSHWPGLCRTFETASNTLHAPDSFRSAPNMISYNEGPMVDPDQRNLGAYLRTVGLLDRNAFSTAS